MSFFFSGLFLNKNWPHEALLIPRLGITTERKDINVIHE